VDFLLGLGLTLVAITYLDDLHQLAPGMEYVVVGFVAFLDWATSLPTRPLTKEEREAYTGGAE